MTIAIIGATGQLGGLTVAALLDRGTPAEEILALGRNAVRLSDLARRGIRTAPLDLEDIDATAAALHGAQDLLLISLSDPGHRLPLHANAVEAARRAGVGHVAYTSVLMAPTTILGLAVDHRATEELIRESGIPATLLRNGWYTENHYQDFVAARDGGVVANSAGDGRLATAPRRDYAEAAAVVVSTPGHEGCVYELSGDTAWSYEEFAGTAQLVLGTPVRYEPLSSDDERDLLLGAGLDEATAQFIVEMNGSIREGALDSTTGDLARLLGRPTEPLEATMRSWAQMSSAV